MAENAPIYLTARNMRKYAADGWMLPCTGLISIVSSRCDFVWESASRAAQEVVSLWPELKEDRITAADLYLLAHALGRSNVKIHLEWRLVRCFLVNWKHQIGSIDSFSNDELANLATSVRDMTIRQIGPSIPMKVSLRSTEMVTMVRIHKEMLVQVLEMMQKREIPHEQKALLLTPGRYGDLWRKFKNATNAGLNHGGQKAFEDIIRAVTVQAIYKRAPNGVKVLREVLEDLEEDLTVRLYNDGDMEKRVLLDLEEDLDKLDRELRYDVKAEVNPRPKPQAGSTSKVKIRSTQTSGGKYRPMSILHHPASNKASPNTTKSRGSTFEQPAKRQKTVHFAADSTFIEDPSLWLIPTSPEVGPERSTTVRTDDQDPDLQKQRSASPGSEELPDLRLTLTGTARKTRPRSTSLPLPEPIKSDVVLTEDDDYLPYPTVTLDSTEE